MIQKQFIAVSLLFHHLYFGDTTTPLFLSFASARALVFQLVLTRAGIGGLLMFARACWYVPIALRVISPHSHFVCGGNEV